jgi:hypothetical protein
VAMSAQKPRVLVVGDWAVGAKSASIARSFKVFSMAETLRAEVLMERA